MGSKKQRPTAPTAATLPLPTVAPPRTLPYRVVPPPPGVPQAYRTVASALGMCPAGGCVERFDWTEGRWLQLEKVKTRPRALEDSREVTTVLSGGVYKKICELCGKNGQTVSAWIRAAVEGRLVGPDR